MYVLLHPLSSFLVLIISQEPILYPRRRVWRLFGIEWDKIIRFGLQRGRRSRLLLLGHFYLSAFVSYCTIMKNWWEESKWRWPTGLELVLYPSTIPVYHRPVQPPSESSRSCVYSSAGCPLSPITSRETLSVHIRTPKTHLPLETHNLVWILL